MGKTTNTEAATSNVAQSAHHPLYGVLGDARCQTVLSILDRVDSIQSQALARGVLADERGVASTDVSSADVEVVCQELHHVYLPRLAAAGLVSWEGDTVETRSEAAVRVQSVSRSLTADEWALTTRHLRLLNDPERRAVLATLAATARSLDLSTLALAIARLEGTSSRDGQLDSLRIALHHVHLPMLDQGGLVHYDAMEKTVELASPASSGSCERHDAT